MFPMSYGYQRRIAECDGAYAAYYLPVTSCLEDKPFTSIPVTLTLFL